MKQIIQIIRLRYVGIRRHHRHTTLRCLGRQHTTQSRSHLLFFVQIKLSFAQISVVFTVTVVLKRLCCWRAGTRPLLLRKKPSTYHRKKNRKFLKMFKIFFRIVFNIYIFLIHFNFSTYQFFVQMILLKLNRHFQHLIVSLYFLKNSKNVVKKII